MSGSYDELFDRASRAMKEGFADNALVPATEAAKIAPDRWEPRLLLARLWLKMGRADRALSDASAVLSLSAGNLPPDDLIFVHDALATANLALGNSAAAEKSLRILDAIPAQPAAAVRLATLLLARGDLAGAREVLGGASTRHPGRLGSRFARAAEARAAEVLAVCAPGHPEAEMAIAELEIGAGILASAKARVQKLYEADPANQRAEEALRMIAEGGGPAESPAARSAESRASSSGTIRLAVLGLLLAIGCATALGAYWGRDFIESTGSSYRPLVILGSLLDLFAIVGLVAELRARGGRRASEA